MNTKRSLLLLTLALTLLAGGLRFWRLGDWPFGGDELSTLAETRSLFYRASAHDGQIAALPRITPLAHLVHQAGYVCFGRTEFGSRVAMALLGTLHCVLAFVLVAGLFDVRVGLATGLLLACWPEHVYYSQYNRFYVTAALFASLAVLAGAWALRRRSAWCAALACVAAFAAVLCHTLTGVLFAGLLVALALGTASRPVLAIVAGGALLAGAFFVFYLLPRLRGWNADASWGTGPLHSLAASLTQVGWPVVLLAVLGGLLALRQHTEQGWYWGTFAVLWVAASLAFPVLVAYHSAYHIPLTLAVFVLAGVAIGRIAEALAPLGRLTAPAWLAATTAMSLPGLLSHYADGSRCDYRTAARYIGKHRQAGDRVAALGPSPFRHYDPYYREVIGLSLDGTTKHLGELAATGNRLWVVVNCGRRGHPEDLQSWLTNHCKRELVVRGNRIDHREFVTEVYTCAAAVPSSADGGN